MKKKSAAKKPRDYYGEIDKAISAYEQGKYADHKMSWIADRIAWCWKFRHNSRDQMESLADRMTEILPLAKYYEQAI